MPEIKQVKHDYLRKNNEFTFTILTKVGCAVPETSAVVELPVSMLINILVVMEYDNGIRIDYKVETGDFCFYGEEADTSERMDDMADAFEASILGKVIEALRKGEINKLTVALKGQDETERFHKFMTDILSETERFSE